MKAGRRKYLVLVRVAGGQYGIVRLSRWLISKMTLNGPGRDAVKRHG